MKNSQVVPNNKYNQRIAYRLGRQHGNAVADSLARKNQHLKLGIPKEMESVASYYEQGRSEAIQEYNDKYDI